MLQGLFWALTCFNHRFVLGFILTGWLLVGWMADGWAITHILYLPCISMNREVWKTMTSWHNGEAWIVYVMLIEEHNMFFLHFEHSNLYNHLNLNSIEMGSGIHVVHAISAPTCTYYVNRYPRDLVAACWSNPHASNASNVGPLKPSPHILRGQPRHGHATFSHSTLAFLCVRNFRSSKLCCLRSSSEIHKPWCVSSERILVKKLAGYLSCGSRNRTVSLHKPKTREWTSSLLVGGFNPSEKYESQLGLSFPIYGKKKHVPTNQNMKLISYHDVA